MKPLKNRCTMSAVGLGLAAICLLLSCAPHRGVSDVGKPTKSRGISVVMPFIDMAKVFGEGASVRNPVSSKIFYTGPVDEDGPVFMTNALYRDLGREKRVVWGSYVDRSVQTEQKHYALELKHLEHLRSIGRKAGADTVLAGYLYAFRDKSGGSYGVEKPAQVVFELVLIHVESGRNIWQRSFKETQKSLSEDLSKLKTFFKRGGRWISAREMGASALKEMLKTLPPSE